ncbi:hypothetical protein Ancab_039719 [Ancistrocladus abbreviatus]
MTLRFRPFCCHEAAVAAGFLCCFVCCCCHCYAVAVSSWFASVGSVLLLLFGLWFSSPFFLSVPFGFVSTSAGVVRSFYCLLLCGVWGLVCLLVFLLFLLFIQFRSFLLFLV